MAFVRERPTWIDGYHVCAGETMSRDRPQHRRIFYGWYVVMAAFIVAVIGNGLQYSFGVFLKPLAEEFEWTRSLTAGAFMLYMVCRAISGIVMGGLSDKYGPRPIVGLGGFLMALGMLLGSMMSNVWHLYIFYGLLVGVGMGVGGVPLWATVSRWFIARRGLALGIVTAGAGIGILIMSPFAGYLIRNYSIHTAYLIMGAISLVLIGLSTLVLKKEPGDLGLKPYGAEEAYSTGRKGPHQEELSEAEVEWRVSQALRAGSFWILVTATFFSGMGFFIVVTNIVAHATDLGVSEVIAPYLLSIIGGSGALGTVVMGLGSEKVGIRGALVLCLGLQGIMLFWLTGVSSFPLFCVNAVIFGFGYGGVLPQVPSITAQFFGLKFLGTILGFVIMAMILGGAMGSVVGNLFYDFVQPHSYIPAFWLGVGFYTAAMVLILILRKPRLA